MENVAKRADSTPRAMTNIVPARTVMKTNKASEQIIGHFSGNEECSPQRGTGSDPDTIA